MDRCRFARGKQSLLDLACGRGGDIRKWLDAGVSCSTCLCLINLSDPFVFMLTGQTVQPRQPVKLDCAQFPEHSAGCRCAGSKASICRLRRLWRRANDFRSFCNSSQVTGGFMLLRLAILWPDASAAAVRMLLTSEHLHSKFQIAF